MDNPDLYIAGIGASAGGLDPICNFFKNIPTNSGVSFVVIFHLPMDFHAQLSESISLCTQLPVTMLENNTVAKPNHIYVLPSHLKILIKNGTFFLDRRNDREFVNTVIDRFLFSLANDKKEKAIGIIFSGGTNDGAKGIYEIHQHQGIVLVQDPTSAYNVAMPTSAININHPDKIMAPEDLGKKLVEIIRSKEQGN